MTLLSKKRQASATQFEQIDDSGYEPPGAIVFSDEKLDDPPWDEILEKLQSFFDYRDDWDGMHGVAPPHELIESAIFIAKKQRECLHPAPDSVSVSCNGTVVFETAASESEPFPVTTLEVLSASEAELYVGGKTLQTFTLSLER